MARAIPINKAIPSSEWAENIEKLTPELYVK